VQFCRSRRTLLGGVAGVVVHSSWAQAVSKHALVAKAERFIAENGYTSLTASQVKDKLDPESFALGSSREQELALRFKTLAPKAIGIKRGARGHSSGWSVAFDYVRGGRYSTTCRVVTMGEDGSNIVMQHVDGKRHYLAGFE
jgi:hypothetical protein